MHGVRSGTWGRGCAASLWDDGSLAPHARFRAHLASCCGAERNPGRTTMRRIALNPSRLRQFKLDAPDTAE